MKTTELHRIRRAAKALSRHVRQLESAGYPQAFVTTSDEMKALRELLGEPTEPMAVWLPRDR